MALSSKDKRSPLLLSGSQAVAVVTVMLRSSQVWAGPLVCCLTLRVPQVRPSLRSLQAYSQHASFL